jgi:hypothetical protein
MSKIAAASITKQMFTYQVMINNYTRLIESL